MACRDVKAARGRQTLEKLFQQELNCMIGLERILEEQGPGHKHVAASPLQCIVVPVLSRSHTCSKKSHTRTKLQFYLKKLEIIFDMVS
eukprot:1418630-Amphidinium_carterae.1